MKFLEIFQNKEFQEFQDVDGTFGDPQKENGEHQKTRAKHGMGNNIIWHKQQYTLHTILQ